MNHTAFHESTASDWLLIAGTTFSIAIYIGAAVISNHYPHLRKWPFHRYLSFIIGICSVTISCSSPLAQLAHIHFAAHMIVHLLLGMIGPLLLALASPLTLILRTVNVNTARKAMKILHSTPLWLLSHPITASLLNIGVLWILYTTNLYNVMLQSTLLHWFIHMHIFLAGYIFTVSVLAIDAMPQRYNFFYRASILLFASAGHNILAKVIYANPPFHVNETEARLGGMLMYYGGDAVDIILALLLCIQWYKTARPRSAKTESELHQTS